MLHLSARKKFVPNVRFCQNKFQNLRLENPFASHFNKPRPYFDDSLYATLCVNCDTYRSATPCKKTSMWLIVNLFSEVLFYEIISTEIVRVGGYREVVGIVLCLGQPAESASWETERNHTARSKRR